MKNNRENLNLYFLGYRRLKRTKFLIPLLFGLAFAVAGTLYMTNIIPSMMKSVYTYLLYGMAGTLLLITVLGFIFGKDKTKIPTTEQVNAMLAEDIETVRLSMLSQLSCDFPPQDRDVFMVKNHCHGMVDSFQPYFKKDENHVLHCSLNKITFLTFSANRMQVFTSIIDMFTGIEIKQYGIKLSYSNIYDCYISYAASLKPESLRYHSQEPRGTELPPQLVQAVKDCKEVLRIKTYQEENASSDHAPLFDFHDILVADYEIYHTTQGVFKNVYNINSGRLIEREIIKRISRYGEAPSLEANSAGSSDGNPYYYTDETDEMQRIHWE